MAKQKLNANEGEIDDTFLEIDEDDLGGEWVKQPKLYFKYAYKLNIARSALDEAKAHLELTTAECDSEIRENPTDYDIPKATDNAVKNKIPQHPKYKEAIERFNKAKRKIAFLDAAVSSLEHKKRALEKLVDLKTTEYYSEPKARKESREAVDDMSTRVIRSKARNRSKE